MDTVRAYADAVGVLPSVVVQRAANVNGTAWGRWERRESSPTLKTADKVLRYIEANPPKEDQGDAA